MSNYPHIHRRRDTLYFRMWVPVRMRPILGVRELTQSLDTQDYQQALPLAYRLASEAKTLFLRIDAAMVNKGIENEFENIDEDLLQQIAAEIERESQEETARLRMIKARQQSARSEKAKLVKDAKIESLERELDEAERRHRREIEQAKTDAELETLRRLVGYPSAVAPAPDNQMAPPTQNPASKSSDSPALSAIFDEFVKQHKGDGSRNGETNKKKLTAFGGLFVSFLGDKRVGQITQKEVNDFFRLLIKYPGSRGGQTAAFKAMTFLERIEYAKQSGGVLISPKNFNAYASSASLFFEYLALHHEELNIQLSTNHIDYDKLGGLRDAGEDKQRSLRVDEVERLINNDMMRGFLKKERDTCKYWLVMIGLFTGGRVNEICQLSPQHDILKDSVSNIWFFNLTEESDAGAGINKTLKNMSSVRRVPIHPTLIECGFEDYLNKIKAAGDDRIFKRWKPKGGKASYYAEEFFRDYLKDIGLRDTTPHKNILGMHSLRSTFISHLMKRLIDRGHSKHQAAKLIQPLVGHCDGTADENGIDVGMTLSYADKDIIEESDKKLSELSEIIEHLSYGVTILKP